MELVDHKLLTLDFWQHSVIYESRTVPTGTLACAVLNISDEVIRKLDELCAPLNLYMGLVQVGQAQATQMLAARESVFQIVKLLRDTPPFDLLDALYVESKVDKVFSEDSLQNATEYAKSMAAGRLADAFNPAYKKALSLLRILPVMAHLGFSLAGFKQDAGWLCRFFWTIFFRCPYTFGK